MILTIQKRSYVPAIEYQTTNDRTKINVSDKMKKQFQRYDPGPTILEIQKRSYVPAIEYHATKDRTKIKLLDKRYF